MFESLNYYWNSKIKYKIVEFSTINRNNVNFFKSKIIAL